MHVAVLDMFPHVDILITKSVCSHYHNTYQYAVLSNTLLISYVVYCTGTILWASTGTLLTWESTSAL